MTDTSKICCKRCGRTPEQITEYKIYSKENEMTPTEYVIKEEGTYNPATKKFYCTECYIALGSPRGKA